MKGLVLLLLLFSTKGYSKSLSCVNLFFSIEEANTQLIDSINLSGLKYHSIKNGKSSEQLKYDLYHYPQQSVPKPIQFKGPSHFLVSKILFMQQNARSKSSKHNGGYIVIENAQALKKGQLSVEDFPIITVWKDQTGKVWTLNHRRLAAIVLSGVVSNIPVRWASTDEVLKSKNQDKFFPLNKGKSIDILFVKENKIIRVNNFLHQENMAPALTIDLLTQKMSKFNFLDQITFLKNIKNIVKSDFQKIGEGYRSNVWKNNNNEIFKVAKKFKDTKKLLAEYLVNQDLKKQFFIYEIHTDEIVYYSKKFTFLQKKDIKSSSIAKNLLNSKKTLSLMQYQKLQHLFQQAKRYANNTGIGLDLKSSNLYWNSQIKDWVIFDLGPRFSYRPYGFTKDLKTFSSYLKIWGKEEPY